MTHVVETTRVMNAKEVGYEELSPEKNARAIWTMIAEPGDYDTGELIAMFGAAEALRLVIETDEVKIDMIDVQAIRERVLPRYSLNTIRAGFRAAHNYDMTLITPEDPHWPTGFNDLGANAPYAIWARGNSAILNSAKFVATVGARAATGYGEHCAMEITAGLVERGHSIVTGAGYGIEGMAIRSALASHGNVVAILAGGVDRFYPSGHDALLQRVVEAGVVISELSGGQAPTKWRFLLRNRLLAALAERIVVIEAGYRSGSLNTSGHAVALKRPLGAVPGPVTSAASAGCHRLIREYGATLVTNAEEVDAL